jgi:CrcB protein
MIAIALVAAGGIIGAPLRYLIERSMTERYPSNPLPLGLLVVNILGSALAGFAVAGLSGELRTFALVGLCGTLTTYSGFGWYVVQRARTHRGAALVSVMVMTALSMLAFWLGLVITQGLVGT